MGANAFKIMQYYNISSFQRALILYAFATLCNIMQYFKNNILSGAADGNRTHLYGLGSRRSTDELRPQMSFYILSTLLMFVNTLYSRI